MRHFVHLAFFFACVGEAAADVPVGDWWTKDQTAKVHIAPCAADASNLCGTIFWTKPKPGNESPGKSKIGFIVLQDMKSSGTDRWKGQIRHPEKGSAQGEVSFVSASALHLKACVALVLCQEEVWSRAD